MKLSEYISSLRVWASAIGDSLLTNPECDKSLHEGKAEKFSLLELIDTLELCDPETNMTDLPFKPCGCLDIARAGRLAGIPRRQYLGCENVSSVFDI